MLLANPEERALATAARATGMSTLRVSAITKALRGETTFEEVLRVTQTDSHEGSQRCTSCGFRLGEDMICCPRCGTDADHGRCRSCAKSLEPDWRVCPWCHTEKTETVYASRDDEATTAVAPRTTPCPASWLSTRTPPSAASWRAPWPAARWSTVPSPVIKRFEP